MRIFKFQTAVIDERTQRRIRFHQQRELALQRKFLAEATEIPRLETRQTTESVVNEAEIMPDTDEVTRANATDSVPRAEFEALRTLLQDVRQRQEQQNATNDVQPLQNALQAFSISQSNQVVYAELAKTPLFGGDGSVTIDQWLKTVIGVLRQCSAPIDQQANLLLGRLTGNAARYATTLTAAAKANVNALSTALREKYRTATDSELAMQALHDRRQTEVETISQYGQVLTELAEIAFGQKIADDQSADVVVEPLQRHLQNTLKTVFLRGLRTEYRSLARLLHPERKMSYRALVTWATGLESKMDGSADVGGVARPPRNTGLTVTGSPFGFLGTVASTPISPQVGYAGGGRPQGNPGWARTLGPLHPMSRVGFGDIAASETHRGPRARDSRMPRSNEIRCEKCQIVGHSGRLCERRPGNCNLCGSADHYRNRCGQRPQNSRNQ
ncbi:MAG: hypothetical protein GY820_38015, partial [Gammaproteobacteria bacterium]|nr:hypothetical protein [Gammaproteobacteria bacterium]